MTSNLTTVIKRAKSNPDLATAMNARTLIINRPGVLFLGKFSRGGLRRSDILGSSVISGGL